MITSSNAIIDDGSCYPRFLVIQHGARHGYAIPLAFQRKQVLAGVFTDLVSTQGAGSMLRRLISKESKLSQMLSRRTPPSCLTEQITAFGSVFLARQALSKVISPAAASRVEQGIIQRLMMLKGTGAATHVYTMFGEGGAFVERAKAQGLGIIGDVYIALSADQIVAEESARAPDWADCQPALTTVEERAARNHVLISQSDLFVCPSRFVRDDLITHGVDPKKTIIAPYAVSPRWLSLEVVPEPGRILFAGSAIIRKGIHTLAAAAKLLEGRCRIRVAGLVSEKIRNHPGAEALNFLGHLGPQQMAAEFARADVFAFPSLVEGSAGVTAEALGAGLPVVTTIQAGSIVRDGVEGHIVPARDAERLAEAIASIVDDRDKRAVMSIAARARALEVDWDGFAQTVLGALDSRVTAFDQP